MTRRRCYLRSNLRSGVFGLISQRLAQLVGILAPAAVVNVIWCAGSALAQSPACPAGTHLYQGSQCCDFYTPPGPDGQCHSLCPAGSPQANDPTNEAACYYGLAPQQDPTNWPNWNNAVCWDGSKPTRPVITTSSSGGPFFNDGLCPRPPGAVCQLGSKMVPAQGQSNLRWTDWTCQRDPQTPACHPPAQVGADGLCHNLCPGTPAGGYLSGYPANQCCPDGQMPDPAAPGTCIACPPGQITVTGYCCPPNYKPGPGHWGSCVPIIPRRELPPPVTVMPPLPGPPPEVTPRYVPRYLPERRRHRPATPRYHRERPSNVTPSHVNKRPRARPVTPSYSSPGYRG